MLSSGTRIIKERLVGSGLGVIVYAVRVMVVCEIEVRSSIC